MYQRVCDIGLGYYKNRYVRFERRLVCRYKQLYKSNQDFITMNRAIEYCVYFIDFCLEEFPEEIEDDSILEDLMEWHERFQFRL